MTTWDPFREMDRLITDVLRMPMGTTAMPMDLYRSGDEFIAKIDLPGVDPSTVDVDIEDRTLTIRAERRDDVGDDVRWLSHERPTGTFARQLTLGYGVDLDHIQANYSDGVLTLTMPVAEEARTRRIAVQHAGGQKSLTEGSRSQTVEGEVAEQREPAMAS
jgi:HSP20 family protein